MSQEISQRAGQILKALVEYHIQDGQPVGSKHLASHMDIGLSSATVRNVLAELEANGLLYSPHTSAGRVPTALGYRLFVDSLLTISPLGDKAIDEFQHALQQEQTLAQLTETASNLLSQVTQRVGLITLPQIQQQSLRHVEFLPLADMRILVILVLNDGDVQNRIIQTDRQYEQRELEQAANYLNQEYLGKDLRFIRQQSAEFLSDAKQELDQSKRTVLDMTLEVLSADQGSDMVVAGEENIIGMLDEQNTEHVRTLYGAIKEKQSILHLLDQSLAADGVQIFIGEGSEHQLLQDCAMVSRHYEVDGEVLGVLGVIGPTRMDYQQVIPIVDVTAKLLSSSLAKLKQRSQFD